MYLGWDYFAEPLWDKDGGNMDLDEYVDDGQLKEEVLSWYEKFTRVEEIIHSYDEQKKKRNKNYKEPEIEEIEKALFELKTELIPAGEGLARRLGVGGLEVDYGHDLRLKDLEFKIFGESDALKQWWEKNENPMRRAERLQGRT